MANAEPKGNTQIGGTRLAPMKALCNAATSKVHSLFICASIAPALPALNLRGIIRRMVNAKSAPQIVTKKLGIRLKDKELRCQRRHPLGSERYLGRLRQRQEHLRRAQVKEAMDHLMTRDLL